jgi:transposase
VRDWRDERIAELEAQGAAKDARIAELEAQVAAKDTRIATLEEQVAMLMKRVTDLEEKLRQNSRNSHQPPSSDSPAERKQRQSSPSPRKRGGQPGHGGAQRELLPEAQVDEIVDLYPAECESCWTALPKVPDRCASRYQQTEMPPVKPHTTEWRRHQVTCPHCGYKTRAAHDEKVIPQSPFGPRLMAIMAMITGIYHVSRRSAVGLLWDLLGVRVSLGALSAVEARVSSTGSALSSSSAA